MLNDHSNPYIESTTVLSDICICVCVCASRARVDHGSPAERPSTFAPGAEIQTPMEASSRERAYFRKSMGVYSRKINSYSPIINIELSLPVSRTMI